MASCQLNNPLILVSKVLEMAMKLQCLAGRLIMASEGHLSDSAHLHIEFSANRVLESDKRSPRGLI